MLLFIAPTSTPLLPFTRHLHGHIPRLRPIREVYLTPRKPTHAYNHNTRIKIISMSEDSSKTPAKPDTPTLVADLDHVALACKGDPLELLSFYSDVIGFTPIDVDRFKLGQVPFPSARASAITILDFFPPELDGPGPGLAKASHMCFAVGKTEWTALKDRVREAGAKINEPDGLRSGARGHAHSFYFRDPETNLLEFRYYEQLDE